MKLPEGGEFVATQDAFGLPAWQMWNGEIVLQSKSSVLGTTFVPHEPLDPLAVHLAVVVVTVLRSFVLSVGWHAQFP